MNLKLDRVVCENMINKSINNINCEEFDGVVANGTELLTNATSNLNDLIRKVCDAETESQKLLSVTFGVRSIICKEEFSMFFE